MSEADVKVCIYAVGLQVPCHLHLIILHGCETWTLLAYSEKRIQAFKTKCLRKLLCLSCLEHKTNDWVRSTINSVWVHRNLFWQLPRDGNLHGSGMSHTTTASPKSSFGTPWRVDDAMFGRGNAGWTTSKSGHPCPCLNRQYTGSCR